jgi:hypothetical protein
MEKMAGPPEFKGHAWFFVGDNRFFPMCCYIKLTASVFFVSFLIGFGYVGL